MAIPARLYHTRALPAHWIVEGSNGDFWLVPVIKGGWLQRRPYHGNYYLERAFGPPVFEQRILELLQVVP